MHHTAHHKISVRQRYFLHGVSEKISSSTLLTLLLISGGVG